MREGLKAPAHGRGEAWQQTAVLRGPMGGWLHATRGLHNNHLPPALQHHRCPYPTPQQEGISLLLLLRTDPFPSWQATQLLWQTLIFPTFSEQTAGQVGG